MHQKDIEQNQENISIFKESIKFLKHGLILEYFYVRIFTSLILFLLQLIAAENTDERQNGIQSKNLTLCIRLNHIPGQQSGKEDSNEFSSKKLTNIK